MAARVATQLADAGGQVRDSVQRNDTGAVHHFVINDRLGSILQDLEIRVIGGA